MDAIVAGKVEKPEGSLGVFRSNGSWTMTQSNVNCFNIASAIPDMAKYPDALTTEYYLKVNSVNNTSFIINLTNCWFSGGSAYNTLTSEQQCQLKVSALDESIAWFGARINFGFNVDNNYLIFTTGNYYVHLSDYITTVEIGTLE